MLYKSRRWSSGPRKFRPEGGIKKARLPDPHVFSLVLTAESLPDIWLSFARPKESFGVWHGGAASIHNNFKES